MATNKTFYLTTTLPYVNAPLHMGHALEFVRADTIARYKKMMGYDVFFNTGTDEHGIKIFNKAKEAGQETQSFVDAGFEVFKEQLKMFGVSEDVHFIRTTDSKHQASAQEFWKRVAQNGYIYKKNYEAKYCTGCESEKTDSELDDNGECPDHTGRPLELISEENYFFKYSDFAEKLLDFYEKNPSFVIPEFRFNEMKSFVKNGLQDFSISRLKTKMPWGVPVPNDPDHVMYVWFDALTNYISTLGWPDENGDFKKYWVEGNPTQYCGKDNTRFQSAMWQAMLMAVGAPNSRQIIVNGFITAQGGVKMSKTLGNVVDPREIVEEYGTDALRYFLLGEVGSFEDSPFSAERFKEAYNAKLSNGIGNLSSRLLTLSEKYLDTEIILPTVDEIIQNHKEYFDIYETFDLKKAVDYVWGKITVLDKKIQDTEPFKLIKTDEAKGKNLISEMVLELYNIAVLLGPLLPETSHKIQAFIKENKKPTNPLFLRK
ncbi:MAG: methionine--tRNA ligase [Candidatus Pacebacteria bacterium]|nr:methionine--tRNA ligase [Candidatus Paceibacterota bacterium]MCF7862636.1 methionine--tRNA ligase [Candidatus Paceibacterota bacterium]